jgi:hypothetical protein
MPLLCSYAEGKGTLPAGHDSAAFLRLLNASLHREIAAVTAAHLAAAQLILLHGSGDGDLRAADDPLSEALEEYRRAHSRTLMTLQVRLVAEGTVIASMCIYAIPFRYCRACAAFSPNLRA